MLNYTLPQFELDNKEATVSMVPGGCRYCHLIPVVCTLKGGTITKIKGGGRCCEIMSRGKGRKKPVTMVPLGDLCYSCRQGQK